MQKSNLGFFRFLIRTSAFIGKEMIEVIRQNSLASYTDSGTISDHVVVRYWLSE